MAAPKASITGTLITEDGKPIPNHRLNFNIALQAANGVYSRSCETNAEGEFQYDSLLPGQDYMLLGQPDANGAAPMLQSFRCQPGESLDLGFLEIPHKPSP